MAAWEEDGLSAGNVHLTAARLRPKGVGHTEPPRLVHGDLLRVARRGLMTLEGTTAVHILILWAHFDRTEI